MKHKELTIENRTKDIGFEQRLVQFLGDEMNGVLIADNKWRCDLTNSSWSIEGVKKEIAYLVDDDPAGVVLCFPQKRHFWQRERWTQVAMHSRNAREP